MSKTETAHTVHGEVEYEAVECCSCENEVAKEEAKSVAIGEYHGKDTWHHKTYDELHFANYTKGYVCEFCADDPVQWPSETFGKAEAAFAAGIGVGIGITVFILLPVIMA